MAAFEAPERKLYGVQFHPEVVHTPHGQEILKNFLYGVADAPATWTAAAVIEEQVERIRAQVGRERVLCGLSGGVDSAVAALLVHKAVGDQLTCVFVDHGLLRKDEAAQVVETFGEHFHVPLVHVDAEERFLARLDGVDRPRGEAPPHRRGVHPRLRGGGAPSSATFRSSSRGRSTRTSSSPAASESAARRSSPTTTSAACPRTWRWSSSSRCDCCSRTRCAESARSWGCPSAMVWRQPFPGPGLAMRIIGEVTHERLEILREADAILQEEVRRAGLYRDLWQCFAVLPAIRSVGVQGDERTYAYPIVIRAVTSEDAMTADWARLPYDLLETISSRIINEIPGVNRVALDISSKPPVHHRMGIEVLGMPTEQYHEPPDELSADARTFARICTSLIEEAEAINWYHQRLDVEKNEEARSIMEDAMGEEFKHFGMDLEFLLRRSPRWRDTLKGILFQPGDIVEHGEQAEEATEDEPA